MLLAYHLGTNNVWIQFSYDKSRIFSKMFFCVLIATYFLFAHSIRTSLLDCRKVTKKRKRSTTCYSSWRSFWAHPLGPPVTQSRSPISLWSLPSRPSRYVSVLIFSISYIHGGRFHNLFVLFLLSGGRH